MSEANVAVIVPLTLFMIDLVLIAATIYTLLRKRGRGGSDS